MYLYPKGESREPGPEADSALLGLAAMFGLARVKKPWRPAESVLSSLAIGTLDNTVSRYWVYMAS